MDDLRQKPRTDAVTPESRPDPRDQPSQRGPNTHYFMPHYANTTVHVLRTVDADGVEHSWEVPAEVVREAHRFMRAADIADAGVAPHYWVGNRGVATGGNIPEAQSSHSDVSADLRAALDGLLGAIGSEAIRVSGPWSVRLADAIIAAQQALAAPSAGAERVCGCTADTELAAGPTCTRCGHRDHGRSGCKAVVR